jgi:hypothetical protein
MQVRRILPSILLCGFLISASFAKGQDPKAIREVFFPSPDTAFTTPAFATKRDFTDSERLLDFLNREASEAQGWQRDTIGYSAKGIPIVAIERGGEASDRPIRVMFIGGIHGDEPAGIEGLLALSQHLGKDGDWNSLLNNTKLRIVPMVNPDGVNRLDRYAANGRDLNRDQSKLENTEMIALKKDFIAFDADVVVDFHQYRPYRADYVDMGDFGVTSPFDVMFMYTGNLNVPEAIRNASETLLIDPARAVMERTGRRYANYFRPTVIRGKREFRTGAASPRSSVTSFGLSSSLAALMEIRGVGLGRKGFERRVQTALLLAKSFLESSAKFPEEIQRARQAGQSDNSPVVIQSQRKKTVTGVTLLDLNRKALRTFEEEVSDSNNQTATATRAFPGGYVLLASETRASEVLRTLGLELTELKAPLAAHVQRYNLVSDQLAPKPFEGFFERIVQAETEDTLITIPSGSWWIPANQPRFHLTKELLEPEGSNGFVRYRVIDPKADEAFPVYRILPKDIISP